MCYLGPVHTYQGAILYKLVCLRNQLNHWLLLDAVQMHRHTVTVPIGCDLNPAALASDHERRRPNAFKRVAKLAACWAYIVRLTAHTHHIVERLLERLKREPWTVVLNRHAVWVNGEGYLRGDACLLARVQSIIDKLFDQHDGPVPWQTSDLHLEFLLTEELHGATC